MENVEEVKRWLREERDRLGWSTADVANRARAFAFEEGVEIKLKQQSVSNFEQPHAKRVPQWMRYVRKAIEAADEETHHDPILTINTGDDLVMVDMLPTYAGAGGPGSGEGDLQKRAFSGSLVRELNVPPADLLLIEIDGDSMQPVFQDGDQLLIDTRKRSLAQPGPFCLWEGDGYVVKYLQRIYGSDPVKVKVMSENPRYDPEERLLEEIDIKGRVVWFGRRYR